MAFIEIPRYHVGCDTPKCNNAFGIVEFDFTGHPIDYYVFEANDAELTQPLIDMLIESEWLVMNNKVYCPACSTSVTNSALLTLKADMGY
jgi:hypothetical protein